MTMIPSSETLMKAFRMTSWGKEKHSQRYVCMYVCMYVLLTMTFISGAF